MSSPALVQTWFVSTPGVSGAAIQVCFFCSETRLFVCLDQATRPPAGGEIADATLAIWDHEFKKREVMDGVTQVILQEGESFTNLLKRFRKKVIRARILGDLKKRRYYISNSEKRHRALRKAVNRECRRQRKIRQRLRRL